LFCFPLPEQQNTIKLIKLKSTKAKHKTKTHTNQVNIIIIIIIIIKTYTTPKLKHNETTNNNTK